MLLRYRYRCYPEPGQRKLLAKAFGCARVVWNDALALNRQLHEKEDKLFDAGALMKRCITEAKRTKERSWLSDASH
ncbi:MAG: transposase, partial [Candidatus Synechococcus spongiarum 142]